MELPYSTKLPIEKLSNCFRDTTNAYKFYWFLSILDDLVDKRNPKIQIKDLALRMIANAWYPLDYYKLSFGKQDSFRNIAHKISLKVNVENQPNSPSLFEQLHQKLRKSELEEIYNDVYYLLRWVPFRFLRPFFTVELFGITDHQVNNRIVTLANSSSFCPYYFEDNYISIRKEWLDYFQSNQIILRGFIRWNLVKYLQKNNPNVIGLTEKLEKPINRELRKARLFWTLFLEQKKTNCIYSNIELESNAFSLDHFIPWTFIAHDQAWNLVPTTNSVNSIKSNLLPSLDLYFDKFAMLQFEAYNLHFNNQRFSLLEDYPSFLGLSFDELNKHDYTQFSSQLKQRLIPFFETAKNLGFEYPFIYKS